MGQRIATSPVVIPILLDDTKVAAQLQGIARKMAGSTGLLAGSALKWLGLGGLAIGGTAGILGTFKHVISEASKAEQATLRLGNALELVGRKAIDQLPHLEAFFNKLQGTTTYSSDRLKNIAASGITRGMRPEGIQGATRAAVGIGAGMGMDPETVMAYMSMTRYGNYRLARRMGIETKGKTPAQVQAAMEKKGGEMMPFEEAKTETLEGSMSQLKNTVDDVAKAFGTGLLPALTSVIQWVREHIPEASGMGESVGSTVQGVVQGSKGPGWRMERHKRTPAELEAYLKSQGRSSPGFFARMFGAGENLREEDLYDERLVREQNDVVGGGTKNPTPGERRENFLKNQIAKETHDRLLKERADEIDNQHIREARQIALGEISGARSRADASVKRGEVEGDDFGKGSIQIKREHLIKQFQARKERLEALAKEFEGGRGGTQEESTPWATIMGSLGSEQSKYNKAMRNLDKMADRELALYQATEKQKTVITKREEYERMMAGARDDKERAKITAHYKEEMGRMSEQWQIEEALAKQPRSIYAPTAEKGSVEAFHLIHESKSMTDQLQLRQAQIKTQENTNDMKVALQEMRRSGITIKGIQIATMK